MHCVFRVLFLCIQPLLGHRSSIVRDTQTWRGRIGVYHYIVIHLFDQILKPSDFGVGSQTATVQADCDAHPTMILVMWKLEY